MNILDSAFGRIAKLARYDDNRPKLMIESQAVAFQNFVELRNNGLTPKDVAALQALNELDKEFPSERRQKVEGHHSRQSVAKVLSTCLRGSR